MRPLSKREKIQQFGDVVSPISVLVPCPEEQVLPDLVPNIMVPTLFSETGSYGSTLLLDH